MLDLKSIFNPDADRRTNAPNVSASAPGVPASNAAFIPHGWPGDVPIPGWWVELAGAFPTGFLIEARPSVCGDSDCRFPVAVSWLADDDGLTWSCPQCGLASGMRPHG